jgi:hypothetical protein
LIKIKPIMTEPLHFIPRRRTRVHRSSEPGQPRSKVMLPWLFKRYWCRWRGPPIRHPPCRLLLAVAKAVGAHVQVLFMAIDPQIEVASGDYISPAVDQIMKDTEEENEKRRRRTKAVFDRLTQEYAAAIDAVPRKNGV